MGVRGLNSFIESNDALLDRGHHLHDTYIIVDAPNLVGVLARQSQKHERRDLFGGDMVQFGRYVMKFFDNLRICKITPVLVFDGAQAHHQNNSKTEEKHKRALERFLRVMSISKLGRGDFVLPASITNVFRCVAVDKDIKIVQAMYEADPEVARIAHQLKCPVASNDSDFFLMDLPYGLIPISSLDHEHIQRFESTIDNSKQSYSYIECSIFKQENFAKYLPELDIRNLPLLGILAGNDFVAANVFERICGRFPMQKLFQTGVRHFKKVNNKQYEKIARILHFLSGKSLNETINQICLQVTKENRLKLKEMIKENLIVYRVPMEDDFKSEISKLYWEGFKSDRKCQLSENDEKALRSMFDEIIIKLVNLLKQTMQHSGSRCLELANKSTIFITGHMDDPQLPSAHLCQIRPLRVMLALLRKTRKYSRPCVVYDRVGDSYKKLLIQPIRNLEDFGKLDYTFFDLPDMPTERRRALLLATFHCSDKVFYENIVDYYHWFEAKHAEEFLIIKFMMDFIDFESKEAKLWKHFRQATLLCVMYHFFKNNLDETFNAKLEETKNDEFMLVLSELIKARRFNKMPMLSKTRKYNCRLMHQITQLQSSIISYNGLNSFLGDVMVRIRQQTWLNSCLIYNLAEGLHERILRLPSMPDIVYNIPRLDKTNRELDN